MQETPGWRFFHAGPEGQSCLIDGLEVWKHEWLRVQGERVTIKDPLYGQIFRFPVYQILSDTGPVRFAAGEFSNGVWGFYVSLSSP